jgi:hypothetical protein
MVKAPVGILSPFSLAKAQDKQLEVVSFMLSKALYYLLFFRFWKAIIHPLNFMLCRRLCISHCKWDQQFGGLTTYVYRV